MEYKIVWFLIKFREMEVLTLHYAYVQCRSCWISCFADLLTGVIRQWINVDAGEGGDPCAVWKLCMHMGIGWVSMHWGYSNCR